MSEAFNPYHVWLGIPTKEQPANRYRLLGIRLFEEVADVIDNAADRQAAHLRTMQTGPHAKLAERLLNEIAAARICLLDSGAKAKYDLKLRASLAAASATERPAASTIPAPDGSQINRHAPTIAPAQLRVAQPLPASMPRARTRRKSFGPPKIMIAGAAVLLAVSACIAAMALSRPKEAILAFNWSPADRAGATLVVDDQSVTIPSSGPWEFHCAGGAHRIYAKRPVYKLETIATVEAGKRQTVEARWKPRATLLLNWPLTERAGAALLVDGIAQQATQRQPWEFPVEPGRHVIHITRPGAETFDATVPVDNDEQQKITVVLPLWPTLSVDWPVEQRKDATLTIDDEPVAIDSSAATLQTTLKPGHHTIRLTRPGFQPIEQTALFLAGTATPLSPSWQPATANPDISIANAPANLRTGDSVASAANNSAATSPIAATGGNASNKLAPPTPAEQGPIAKELNEIYKGTHVAAKDRTMIAEMLKAAGESGTSPAERFVLLKKATMLAAASGDFEAAFQAVDILDATYDIDAFAVKQKVLRESIPALATADQLAGLVAAAELLINQAVAADHYDAALAVVVTAKEAIAKRPSDLRMFKDSQTRLVGHQRQIAALQSVWSAVKDARQTLEKDPADRDANLSLGRWYCLLKNDWSTGLPFLSKASDEGLKSLATEELAGSLDVAQQNQLADGWWDQARKETDLAHDNARLHASELYRLVLPKLQSPLKKTAIEQRLAETATVSSDGGSTTAARGGTFHHDQWIDLLHLVNPATDTVYGTWTRKGPELICEPAEFSRLRFPIEVTGSYDLEIEFTRNEGNDEITTIIPVGGQPLLLILSAFDGKVSGFSRVAGVSVRDQHTYAFRPGKLENGRRYRLLISVRVLKDNMASIETWLQGKVCWPVWKGPRTDLLPFAGWGLPTARQIGIGAWKDKIVFHSARLRILSGEATASLPMTAPPPTVRIVSARFGGGSNWSDVTQAALAAIRNGEPVWAAVSCLHADPTPGWRKHLDLNFDNSGKPESASFDEGAGWKMDPVLSR